MKFKTKSKCVKCGREFITYKRYDDFVGKWELDSESCDECSGKTMKYVEAITPIGELN